MNYAVQMAKIISAALAGDTRTVTIYAAWIAAQLDNEARVGTHQEKEDAARQARIIRRSYGAEPAGNPVALDTAPASNCGHHLGPCGTCCAHNIEATK